MKKLGLLLVVVMLLGACASSAPEATPTPMPTSTPAPTDTPGLLATPTPSARTETTFVEPIRRQIFDDLVDAQGGISGNEEARATVAERWGISVDAAEEIILEGLEKGWLMPTVTPIPPTATPIPPTATVACGWNRSADQIHFIWLGTWNPIAPIASAAPPTFAPIPGFRLTAHGKPPTGRLKCTGPKRIII